MFTHQLVFLTIYILKQSSCGVLRKRCSENKQQIYRRIPMPKFDFNKVAEVFLGKGVLRICSKFTGDHQCRSVISIKLLSNFIEITLRHGFSPVNLLHIFTSFPKNTCGRLLLHINELSLPELLCNCNL